MLEAPNDSNWRQAVLETVLAWAVRMGAIIAALLAVVLLLLGPDRLFRPEVLVMYSVYAGMIFIRYRPQLGFRVRVLGLEFALSMLAVLGFYQFGFAPVPVLALALMVVSCGLFLGRAAMWAGLGLSCGVFLMLAGFHAAGHHGAPEQWLNPGNGLHWMRAAVEQVALTGTLAVLVAHVVAVIESARANAVNTLAELRREQARRHEALAELADAEQTLARAQKLDALGLLAAGVGHDFNNTLQVVLSWASLLQDEQDPELRAEAVGEIIQAAERGTELPRHLLALGRRGVTAATLVDPSAALNGLVPTLRRVLPAEIELREQVGPTPLVCIDAGQLDQIILNLGINARDAMPKGGVLTLGAETVAAAQIPQDMMMAQAAERWAHLWVEDTGTGMPPNVRQRAFEPFFTTKGSGGTGLGLATAYGIVRRHSGGIVVESELGSGTALHIYLPERSGVMPVTPTLDEGPDNTTATLLLVEDERAVRKAIAHGLEAAGFVVTESENAIAALEVLARSDAAFEVLCTDGAMPGGRVAELIDTYQRRCPQGVVLLCSGYLPEELLRRNVDAGELPFLAKPFTPAELVCRVRELLRDARRSLKRHSTG